MKNLIQMALLLSIAQTAFPCAFELPGLKSKEKFESSITRQQFTKIIDHVSRVYTPIFAQEGKVLHLQDENDWLRDRANAYAYQAADKRWTVKVTGGLARHPSMTLNGLAIVLCHEIGHILGGAPKYWSKWPWASVESQADYFATLHCAKKVFAGTKEQDIRLVKLPPFVKESCESSYMDKEDQLICKRSAAGSMSVGKFFQAFYGEEFPPSFLEKDRHIAMATNEGYPSTQCRLDTLLAGSRCQINIEQTLDDSDPLIGTCNRRGNFKLAGVRPKCWYFPN